MCYTLLIHSIYFYGCVFSLNTKIHEQKSQSTTIVLSYFFGWLGVDRFYLGYIGTGILKLITFGGCGIWWLLDLIQICQNNLTPNKSSYKSTTRNNGMTVFLALFGGVFGLHRLYLGYKNWWIMLITGGMLGIMSFIDICRLIDNRLPTASDFGRSVQQKHDIIPGAIPWIK